MWRQNLLTIYPTTTLFSIIHANPLCNAFSFHFLPPNSSFINLSTEKKSACAKLKVCCNHMICDDRIYLQFTLLLHFFQSFTRTPYATLSPLIFCLQIALSYTFSLRKNQLALNSKYAVII